MTTELTKPATSTDAQSGLRAPARTYQYSFYTQDHKATRHFYEDIAGLTLRTFWIEPAAQATEVGTEQPMSAHVALKVDQ